MKDRKKMMIYIYKYIFKKINLYGFVDRRERQTDRQTDRQTERRKEGKREAIDRLSAQCGRRYLGSGETWPAHTWPASGTALMA